MVFGECGGVRVFVGFGREGNHLGVMIVARLSGVCGFRVGTEPDPTNDCGFGDGGSTRMRLGRRLALHVCGDCREGKGSLVCPGVF